MEHTLHIKVYIIFYIYLHHNNFKYLEVNFTSLETVRDYCKSQGFIDSSVNKSMDFTISSVWKGHK